MQNSYYPIDISVNGNPVKQYNHAGKLFLEGKEGTEYTIEIKNKTAGRILAVVSVDGLNVVNGELASPEGIGYVINGYGKQTIKGFRHSENEVAAFKFSSKAKSYEKNQTGETANAGVIGVRIYEEKALFSTIDWLEGSYGLPLISAKPEWVVRYSDFYCDNTVFLASSLTPNITTNFVATSNNSQPTSFGDLGTAWGSNIPSKSKETAFILGNLVHSFDIFYASRETLKEIGVPLVAETKINFPTAFPRKYAVPPADWTGILK